MSDEPNYNILITYFGVKQYSSNSESRETETGTMYISHFTFPLPPLDTHPI